MTPEQLFDLEALGRGITDTCKCIKTLSALYKGRKFLAKGLRNKYPNMPIDAIRSTLWKQECEQAKNYSSHSMSYACVLSLWDGI